jgi:ABC-type multidrug transport system ATPase subunit
MPSVLVTPLRHWSRTSSFVVEPGPVTGFLGPNGAGKSTTMRMVLGLDTPSSGSVLVNGKPYRDLDGLTFRRAWNTETLTAG